ncbi:hypothetical protein OQA88_8105 [Cercophora sp. LCS_1]
MASEKPIPYTQFACIGAGFSGICLGATLQRWYGITDLRIFEQTASLGGTWSINRYPGAACDVPSALYSFSFSTNPNWTRILPTAPELSAYLEKVASDYSLPSKITYNTRVTRCEWHESSTRWRLTLVDTTTNDVSYHECQFLFSGAGQFSKPRPLDVPGIESFKGKVMHSARWDSSVSLRDKKVVVFGNGCTAAQIVPSIVPDCAQLTQIVRSKHWIMPPIDQAVPPRVRKVLQYTPGMLALQRFIIFCLAEADFPAYPEKGKALREKKRGIAERYMKRTAPKKYWDLLIPDFEYGTKRRIFDSGYLEALHRENLRLTDEKAVEVLEDGVKLSSGEVVQADVLVLANGFEMNQYPIEVVGRGGKTIEEHWEEIGGMAAYNCTHLSGFPNFTLLLGPNTATGHTSTVMAIENATNFALRILRPALEGEASIVDVKQSAELQYAHTIQDALQKTVWNTGGSHSWYTKEVEVDGKHVKRNGMTFPWWQGRYWSDCLFPVWKDFEYQGNKTGVSVIKKKRSSKAWVVCLGLLVTGLMAQWAKANPSSPVVVAVMTAALRAGMWQVPGTNASVVDLAGRISSVVASWRV